MSTPSPKNNILVVDDTPENIRLLRQILEDEGYGISAVTSGKRALSLAARNTPDLILLDVMMPDMDGFETCRHLKKDPLTKNIPVIFVTAKTEAESVVKAFQAGGVDYLIKPIRQEEVCHRVRAHLNEQDLKKAQRAQVLQAERLTTLGSLVGGFTHELSTPLSSTLMALTHLKEISTQFQKALDQEPLTKTALNEYIATNVEGGRIALATLGRSIEMVQSFKQVAVDQCSPVKRPFLVEEYLQQILLTLKPRLKKTRHTIEVQGKTGALLDSYPGAFSQIITNLVMNSLVHAYSKNDAGQIRIQLEENSQEQTLQLCYSDDGKGIPKDHLDQIFNKYFTTERDKGGSGLGLAIVHELVTETLEGTIRCESQEGQGVKFLISLPLGD